MKRCLTSKHRRPFSPEFKQQAASLVLDQGYSHMEASRSVDVGETVLCHWVQQRQMERRGVVPQGKAITPVNGAFRNSRRVSNASSVRRPF